MGIPIALVMQGSMLFHAGYCDPGAPAFTPVPTLCGRNARKPVLRHDLDGTTCRTCRRKLTDLGELAEINDLNVQTARRKT